MNAVQTKAYLGRNGDLYKTALEAQLSFDIAEINELVGKFNSLGSLARGMSSNPIAWAQTLGAIAQLQREARAIDEANAAGKGVA